MATKIIIGDVEAVLIVDEKDRKLLNVEVINERAAKMNFPGINDKDLNYLKLESAMKYYMKMEDGTLSEIVDLIIKNGFFYPLRPGLEIKVERV